MVQVNEMLDVCRHFLPQILDKLQLAGHDGHVLDGGCLALSSHPPPVECQDLLAILHLLVQHEDKQRHLVRQLQANQTPAEVKRKLYFQNIYKELTL